MTDKKFIDELVENGKKSGTVSLKEILEVVLEDSEEFEEIKKTLEAEEILIEDDEFSDDDEDLDNYDDLYEEDPDDIGEITGDDVDSEDSEDFDDFIDKIENDPEFAEFTIEIENELKTKDIEDLIPSTTIISADDPVKMYLKEIGQIPLLTAQRELELSRTIQEGLAAEEMLESIKKNNKTVSPEEMEKKYDNIKPSVVGLNNNLEISSQILPINIVLKGTVNLLKNYDIANNSVFVDCSKIKEAGEYEVPIEFKFGDAISVNDKNSYTTKIIVENKKNISEDVLLNEQAQVNLEISKDNLEVPQDKSAENTNELNVTSEDKKNIDSETSTEEKPVKEDSDSKENI